MEKLQGPINPCQIIAEDMEVGNWLEEFISSTTTTTAGSMKYEDPYNYYSEEGGGATYSCLPSLEDKMPFLQMLQTVEQQQQQQPYIQHFEPTNFQFLLRLQHQLVESCVTGTNYNHINHNHGCINDGMIVMDIQHSAEVKSETTEIGENVEKCNNNGGSGKKTQLRKKCTAAPAAAAAAAAPVKEKRKRKRAARPAKNKQEVETQRMTHIAVERNRRRQMNEHLNALRSLMPPSYVQRGDQASIIGGAIDFVKELEQMLQSLQAQKKMKQTEENGDVSVPVLVSPSSTSSSSNLNNLSNNNSNVFMASPSLHSHEEGKEKGKGKGNGNEQDSGEGSLRKSNEEFSAEKKTGIAEIEVVVIQNHVNLKIKCQRRQGQLIKAIVAFEELRLTVLHLNITSLHTLVHYSFNLKIEEDCKLGTADDVARAVHQIFSLINLS